jgi:hypothetical protein
MEMDQSDLVLDIVFNLDSAFTNLTIDECRNIFRIFPAYRYLFRSKNIKNAFNKYLTIHIYDELWKYLMNSYLRYYLRHECKKEEYIEKNKENIENIIIKIPNEEIKDCFDRLLIAEYKELFYQNHSARMCISYELEMIESFVDYYFPLSDNDENDIIYIHKHDPNHYMFAKDIQYTFYDYEKTGNNLFE